MKSSNDDPALAIQIEFRKLTVRDLMLFIISD